MGVTNRKGEIGEAMVLADLQRKGYGVAIPFGHDLPFDLDGDDATDASTRSSGERAAARGPAGEGPPLSGTTG